MATTEAIIIQTGAGLIAGLVYGFVWYARNRLGNQPAEKRTFKPVKLTATLIVAALIGALAGASGAAVNYESVTTQLVTYVGAISLVEAVLKTIYERWL